MKALIHVLCAAVAFVAVDFWKAPAAFAIQQLKKASQWVNKAKKRKQFGRPASSVRRELVRQQTLEFVREHSPALWQMMNEAPQPGPAVQGGTSVPEGAMAADEPLEGEDPVELEQEDDIPVDMETFYRLWHAYMEGEAASERTAAGIEVRRILDFIQDWLGTPYRFGGVTPQGIDCSAFIRRLFAEVASVTLPRTAAAQFTLGMPVKREELQFGDLVFFHTRRHVYVSHVGIYLGDDLFAHASSRYGVTISSLRSTYYSKRFIGARRLTERTLLELQLASGETVPGVLAPSN
ncbi:MAG: C40 family peptidase [Candidatus Kapabacteria bacterium]|nr:C40 family peptidase [Candidatus Kapabacteria bacterium]MDW8012507.1 C40 family peptidase [Bacteroidota bacterium]